MPDATCAPVASRAKQKSKRDSHHRSAERSGTPCANGFNGLLRALPGDRALLSPSSARCMSIVTDLMPASRHQDHAISPYAFHAVRHRRKGVHRIPHPTFVTIAKRPSSRARDAQFAFLRESRKLNSSKISDQFLRREVWRRRVGRDERWPPFVRPPEQSCLYSATPVLSQHPALFPSWFFGTSTGSWRRIAHRSKR